MQMRFSYLLAALICAQPVWAEKLTHEGVTVQIDSSSQTVDAQIAIEPQSTAVVELIENPYRIVLDITPAQKNGGLKRNKTFTVKHPPIKSVRLGAHPDKIRVVFDLTSTARPNFNFSAEGGVAALQLMLAPAPSSIPSKIESAAPSPAATEKPRSAAQTPIESATPEAEPTSQPSSDQPKATPIDVSTTESTPTQSAQTEAAKTETTVPQPVSSAEPETSKNQQPITTPSPQVTSTPPRVSSNIKVPQPQGRILEKISFDIAGEKRFPIVRLALSVKSPFTLARTGALSYTLTLSEASLAGPHLELPYFPPSDFSGLSVVQARGKNGQVEITIGVEGGVKLASVVKDKEIWIRTTNK